VGISCTRIGDFLCLSNLAAFGKPRRVYPAQYPRIAPSAGITESPGGSGWASKYCQSIVSSVGPVYLTLGENMTSQVCLPTFRRPYETTAHGHCAIWPFPASVKRVELGTRRREEGENDPVLWLEAHRHRSLASFRLRVEMPVRMRRNVSAGLALFQFRPVSPEERTGIGCVTTRDKSWGGSYRVCKWVRE
jgi:hypothetical protein